MPAAGIGQQKGPSSQQRPAARHTTNASEAHWTKMFCLIPHIHLTSRQPTTSSSNISKTFCREYGFHNQQEAENAFQEAVESQSVDFYATGINNLLIGKDVLIVHQNGSYFD